MVFNFKEIVEMINIVKKNNVFLMEGMKIIFMFNFLWMKENIYKIGKIRRYFVSYC